MDNDAKLSKDQIKNLLFEFKNADKNSSVNTNDFLKQHLNENQAQTIKNVLSNPQLMKKILSSQKTQDFLKQLKGEEKNES